MQLAVPAYCRDAALIERADDADGAVDILGAGSTKRNHDIGELSRANPAHFRNARSAVDQYDVYELIQLAPEPFKELLAFIKGVELRPVKLLNRAGVSAAEETDARASAYP